jgi:hypothetical protein
MKPYGMGKEIKGQYYLSPEDVAMVLWIRSKEVMGFIKSGEFKKPRL